MTNRSVNTDAQGSPRASHARFLGRRYLHVRTHTDAAHHSKDPRIIPRVCSSFSGRARRAVRRTRFLEQSTILADPKKSSAEVGLFRSKSDGVCAALHVHGRAGSSTIFIWPGWSARPRASPCRNRFSVSLWPFREPVCSPIASRSAGMLCGVVCLARLFAAVL